jgi:hypothetical protein
VKEPASRSPGARDTTLYDADFYAWSQRTAALLRARRLADVDVEHAAEEIADMGRREVKELNSRMQVLLSHLLKWQLQPERRSPSWHSSIVAQRLEIDALLDQSPSLRPKLVSALARNYVAAVKRAVPETGLGKDAFPVGCPFSVEQILDEEFLPA